MSGQLTQLINSISRILDKAFTASSQAAARIWHMASSRAKIIWRSANRNFREISEKRPGWKNIFKNRRTRIKPVRPDLPAVKDETAIAAVEARTHRKKPIRRRGRQRVYRLKGYTTVAKVNRKHKSEVQQSLLRKALIFIAILLVLILLYNLYNPFNNIDLKEWYRIIGISEWSDLFKDNPLLPDLTPTPEAP